VNSIKVSAWLGLALGVFLAFQKYNLDPHFAQAWPLVLYDYLAPALLALGAMAVLRGGTGRWLAAGWGFVIASTYLDFFTHMNFQVHTRPLLSFSGALSVPAGVLLAINVLGLALALLSSKEAHQPAH